MRRLLILAITASLAGCGENPEETAVSDPTPPPAFALSGQHQSLDDGLKLLDAELAEAMKGDLGSNDSKQHLLRAEAITDRLLETEMPFYWLKRDYSVESVVRQIQALADRIVAKMRNGLSGVDLQTDVRSLRRQVLELRQELAQGGGPAPPSLDTLLARYTNDSTVVSDVGE